MGTESQYRLLKFLRRKQQILSRNVKWKNGTGTIGL
jgi:hypothetical protein